MTMAKEILVRKASVDDAEAIVGIFNPIIEVVCTPFLIRHSLWRLSESIS